MTTNHEDIARPYGRDLSDAELEVVACQLAARPELWLEHVSHDPDHRTYRQLLRDEHLDVWLLCWSRDHDTGFHDHDLSAGAVAVAAGSVREDRLVLGRSVEEPISRVATAGSSFSFTASDIHRVLHAGDGPAVTIHAYSPPLTRMGSYMVEPSGQLRRHAVAYEDELRQLDPSEVTRVARKLTGGQVRVAFAGMTDERRPILIAYDGSDCAAAAIDKVAEEFGPRKAIVLVVSEDLDKVPFLGTSGVPVEAETMELLTDAAQKGAQATAEKGAERARALGLEATTAIYEGGPVWSAIVEAAEEHDAALIALGSRGLSGVKHVVLGSVSGAVAHHSHRSVLIVHST